MTEVKLATRLPATSPDPERLAADLGLAIGRLARRLRQQADGGVTASLLSALWTIEGLEPVTLGDLAAAERVQPPTITRVVSRLEESGLVTREIDPADRRVARIALTPHARLLLDRTRSRRTAYLAKALRSVGSKDRAVLARAVELMHDLLQERG
jgi:DNA-binding MarR family transcriptional regulator